MNKIEKLIPDTSVIIEGLVSKKIEDKEILPDHILIHEAVIAELEHQANLGRSIGFLGIGELKRLKELSKKLGFDVAFSGRRPSAAEIKYAKLGEIDSLIRDLAYEEDGTLFTADKVLRDIAEAKGIKVLFFEIEIKEKTLILERFFDETTMSVHLRENVYPGAKKGIPGNWKFTVIEKKKLSKEDIKDIAKEIVEESRIRSRGFLEIEREGSTIVQLGSYRIVITRPPFSDGWEITAVRPVKKLDLEEYSIGDKLKQRIAVQAEGMLIAGAPGQGKSTFAQALAEFYSKQDKIVKTVEAPRDLQLPDNITQYAISHGSPQEIHDILLLSRPDYTIFDEMRNTEDFRLFSDLRLSGVGMVGVVHATNPIDAIQRFIGRIELGVIPQVIDTVIFIKEGKINKVFNVQMQVKVPSGMVEADLARPVVTVTDFETGRLEFEIYSYGEETVVVPVQKTQVTPAKELAARTIKNAFSEFMDVKVDVVSDNKCIVYALESNIAKIIGKQGKNIEKFEKKLGICIDVLPIEKKEKKENQLEFETKIADQFVVFFLDPRFANKNVDIYINDDYMLTANIGKKGVIRIKKKSNIGRELVKAINFNENIRIIC